MPTNQIHPGDLIFFRGRDWKSRLIMAGTGPIWHRGFSHVGFASYVSGHNGLMLIDSTTLGLLPCVVTEATSGVRARPLEQHLAFYPGEVWVYPLDLSETATRAPYHELGVTMAATEYATSQLGKKYDLTGAFHSRGTFLCGLLWKLGKIKESRDALFCSELVGNWLKIAGLLKCKNVSKLNPTTLEIMATDQGAFREPWRWTR